MVVAGAVLFILLLSLSNPSYAVDMVLLVVVVFFRCRPLCASCLCFDSRDKVIASTTATPTGVMISARRVTFPSFLHGRKRSGRDTSGTTARVFFGRAATVRRHQRYPRGPRSASHLRGRQGKGMSCFKHCFKQSSFYRIFGMFPKLETLRGTFEYHKIGIFPKFRGPVTHFQFLEFGNLEKQP